VKGSKSSANGSKGSNGSVDSADTADSAGVPKLTFGQKVLLALPNLRRGQPADPVPEVLEPEPRPKKPVSKRPAAKLSALPAPADDAELAALGSPDVEDVKLDELEDGDHAQDEIDGDGDGDGDDAEPDERPKKVATRAAGSARSKGSARPPAPSQFDSVGTEELVALVKRLDDKERKLALIAVPLGIVLAAVTTTITVLHDPAVHHKGYENPSLIITDGLITGVFALGVFAAAWYRRRSFTSFALLFLGYSLGLVGVGIPFLFLGGYLLFRMYKVQKVLTARGVNTRTRDPKRRPADRTSTTTTRQARTRKDTSNSVGRPQQSKRYTPPKPPPKRPPAPKIDPEAKPKRTLLERAAERVDRPEQAPKP